MLRTFVRSNPESCGFLPEVESCEQEPSILFAVSDMVRRYGGRVSRLFLDQVEEFWEPGTFHINVQNDRLVPGEWPSLGIEWHTDGPEQEGFLHVSGDYISEHFLACVVYEGPEDVTTEFVKGNVELKFSQSRPKTDHFKKSWWHPQVEEQVRRGDLGSMRAKNRELIRFNHQCFHRAPLPVEPGRRLLLVARRYQNMPYCITLRDFQYEPTVGSYILNDEGTGWSFKPPSFSPAR